MHKRFIVILLTVLFFIGCTSSEKKTLNTQPAITLPKPDPEKEKYYFKNIFSNVRRLVPAQFHLTINEEEKYFTISIDHYKVCTTDNLKGQRKTVQGVSIIDYSLKKSNISEITYIMRYTIKVKITEEEQQRNDLYNDSLDNEINKLPQRFKHSYLWEGSASLDYVPRNKEERLELKAYNKAYDSIVATVKRRPNYNLPRGYSVFITDNLPKDHIACDSKSTLALGTMKKDLEEMFTRVY